MKPLRILFVDDEEASIQTLRALLETELKPKPSSLCCNFDDAVDALDEFEPDIVVLDLVDDGQTGDAKDLGNDVYKKIWEHRFCPVVVYSAHAEVFSGDDHPFVSRVSKGSKSPGQVKSAIDGFSQHLAAVREAHSFVTKEFSFALRDVAGHAFAASKDPKIQSDSIVRAGRRRLAAFMDGMPHHGRNLAPWEQYLHPPVDPQLRLGDVLQLCGSEVADPENFRIVISPSCDIDESGGRKPKVEAVLVAKCMDPVKAVDKCQISRDKKRITVEFLNPGFARNFVILPPLPGKIPAMAADMKDLELVPFAEIGESKTYVRVASIDSPFREVVSWGYMQVACRPGLPLRELDTWADAVLAFGSKK